MNSAKYITFIGILALLGACKSVPNPIDMPNGNYKASVKHVPYVAATPLRDLNITPERVPNRLANLQNPYGTDTHTSCSAVLAEARAIETAIRENGTKTTGVMHQGETRAAYVGNAADVTTKVIATSLIPFRGAVRYFSGATKHDSQKRAADQRARERLGFLVGVGSANACPGFGIHTRKLH